MELNKLQFDGIFQGKENEIRITENNMISVFDFIKVAGGQENPRDTWYDIEQKYKNELVGFSDKFQFQGKGQRKTPVISVQGMVKLLFLLPGETAKQFRSKSAETMIRYLGGDLTLIDEIKKIDQEHINNPNNIAQVFRNEVNSSSSNCQIKLVFNQDQINTSNKLITHYGDKNNIFYMFSFLFNEEYYAKFGIVHEVRGFHNRVQEHIKEFDYICFHNIMHCSNITKVEADFKETALFNLNKVKIPKKNAGNHIEIIKLSEIITTEVIKQEMIKVAGDRMIDPPPMYQQENEVESNCTGSGTTKFTLDIEKERTKQMEIQLEIKKLELEMKKLELNVNKEIKQEVNENQEDTVNEIQVEVNTKSKKNFYNFLKEYTIYQENAQTTINELRKEYCKYIGQDEIKKLNNVIIKNIDNRYTFSVIAICRHCNTQLYILKDRCCELYTKKGRTNRKVILNLRLKN